MPTSSAQTIPENKLNITIAQFEGIDNTPSLPLAAGVLIATAKQNPELSKRLAFDIVVPRVPIEHVVEELKKSTLIGFSLYPWNYAYSLAVIQALHTQAPHIPILVGGPSLPKRKKAILHFISQQPDIDFLLLGEAEENFALFLLQYLNEQNWQNVPSLVYRTEKAIEITSLASRVHNFAKTGSPYLDGTFAYLIQKYPGFFQMGVLETNRGCPFLCTFCDWSITRKVMEYPLGRIQHEIDWLVEQSFINLCIIDANFGIRKRDAQIAQYLAHKKQETGKPGFCYFYLTKNNHQRNWETIETFNKAGIHCCVGLAVQDFDDAVLKEIRRDKMQSMETLQLRDICAQQGIPTRNELILGLPKQTYQSFVQTLLRSMPPHPKHDFIIFLCRLLQNTELANPEQQRKHRIQTRRCLWVSPKGAKHGIVPEYQNIIVATADLPLEDWKRIYRFAHFASMAYNKYLLRILLRAWTEIWQQPRQTLLEKLLQVIEKAPTHSIFHRLHLVLNRYVSSIMREDAYLLPFPNLGDSPWELDESLSIVVLLHCESFYQEIERALQPLLPVKEHPKLHECLRFQKHLIPQHQASSKEELFKWDWLQSHHNGTLQQKPTHIVFSHPFPPATPQQQRGRANPFFWRGRGVGEWAGRTGGENYLASTAVVK